MSEQKKKYFCIYYFFSQYFPTHRSVLSAGKSLPPSERRDQSYQVSEGEGEGCQLERQAQDEEKEPATQLYVSEKQTASVVSHRDVSASAWDLHPAVLCGKFNNYHAFYWNKL